MLPFFWYMLKVIICSGILFGYYWLFLRNKIFHRYNRFYLLAAMSLSLLLPLLKINFWQPAAQQNQAIRVLQAVSAGDEYMNNMVITAQKSNWNFEQLYPMIYLLVSIIFLFLMIRTLYLIRTLLKRYPVQQIEQVSFVNTEDDSTPFSFLKYIFWNSSIDMGTTTGRQIFKHEVAHIEEKHTHDKLFVNLVLIFCWCNPFFWLYRKELNMIHEFIADKKAVEDSDTAAFAAMILQAAYPKHRFGLANNFFYSPIKRRLLMLTKIDNPKISYITRLMVLPLAVLVFAAFTFKAKNNNSLYPGKKITVVIDAGHGGKDLGASSTDGIFEKDLTLAIAKKVKELNTNDAVEIILVRDDDVYMSATEKVDFTKIKNADLFISFHVDNGPKESANKSTGMSCSVAKDEFSNAGQSKLLASAIVNEFNDNYGLPVMQQLKQLKVGVLTLQGNNCPAVLIETGFINNEKDRAYLQTDAAKTTIANNVLNAIEKFASMNKMAPVKEKFSQKDTVPDNRPIDPEKALLIVNGKIIGKGKKATEEFNNLVAPSVSVKWLNRSEAIAKYGTEGADGACEVNYNEGAVFTTTFVDSDKMSVFYIGINNPVKITAPNVKPEDLVVNISEGSISGINGNYIVRVTHIGEVTITLAKRDGTKIPASFTARVKRVPDPTDPNFPPELKKNLKVDSSSISQRKQKLIQEQQDKAQLDYAEKQLQAKATDDLKLIQGPLIYLGAKSGGSLQLDYLKSIKEISMSPGFKLVSATMFFEGPGFDKNVVQVILNSNSLSPAATSINRCKDGTIIVFGGVKVADENGVVKTLIAYNPVFFVGPLNKPQSNTTEKKQEALDLQKENQKLLLEKQRKAELNYAEKQLQYQSADAAAEKAILERKLREQDLRLQQQNKEKLNFELEQARVKDLNVSANAAILREKELQAKQNNIIFTKAELSPHFTGGEEAWRKYLRENLKATTPVDEGWKAGKYTVTVKFIVHTDGTVSDITTENYKGTKTAQHCIDVIKNAPKWQPAIQNGKKVNAYKKQPITFMIEE